MQKHHKETQQPGSKKKYNLGARQNRDKNRKKNQDYNTVLKIQVECEELCFISDMNIISWFRNTKLCFTDGAVLYLKVKDEERTWKKYLKTYGEQRK